MASKNFSSPQFKKADLAAVLDYIEGYWPKLVRTNKKDLRTLIGLPNPYIVPADVHGIFQEQYYWDSYPVVKAFIDRPKYRELAIGMVENFFYLIDRFGIIPNASRFYFLSRSQPPLLSSMVFIVFNKTGDLKWLKKAISYVEYEYKSVWMGRTHLSNFRHTEFGLCRYYDINALDSLAEAESGWDMTKRFDDRCLDFLPVDLNCLLYVYEEDLAKAYEILGYPKKARHYKEAAWDRAGRINELMWNEKAGYYYDFDFVNKKMSKMITLAGVYPLNVGIASQKQAERVVEVIEKVLETKWGVVQGEKVEGAKQWDFPNGWPPLQVRTVEALMRYGYNNLARRLVLKWISLNIKVFKETGFLWEKYDVVSGKVGVPDRYPTPSGFAWTNAVFLIMLKILDELSEIKTERAMPIFLARGLGWY